MAITNLTSSEFKVMKLRDGGFLVFEGGSDYDSRGAFGHPVLGCTDLGEALAYIREKMQPKVAT